LVMQAGRENFAPYGVGERDVRAHVQTQPKIGPLRGAGTARVNHVEFCAVAKALQQMMEKDWVGFPGIRSPQQNHIGIFNFAIRAGAAPGSKNRRQTGDAGGVSSSVATIDIVGAHDAADEFLRGVIYFVNGLGAAEHAEVMRVVPGDGFAEGGGDATHGLVPSGRTMGTVFAD
jgi:hypothetical protein